MEANLFDALRPFGPDDGRTRRLYSLPRLEEAGVGPVSRLPVSIRVLLESVLRNAGGRRTGERDVRALANWRPGAEGETEVGLVVARVLLQDFTGVPLLVDLAAMRSAVARMGRDPGVVEPLVPVDLVVDHSVQVDHFGTPEAFGRNHEIEIERNRPRYEFLKWGQQAFDGLTIVPSGIGICHQVNLEYLSQVVMERDGVYFPDTLVGTDSHTTMVNGLGVVGWGVGGIEAEAAMLGQPVYFPAPEVVGVHLSGALGEGVTATDLVLHITELLRREKVVGKFVEFHGDGAATLAVADRATIGNMAPEYGATIGYFPVDERSCAYLLATGRPEEHVETVRAYYEAQGMFGMPRRGECDYSQLLELDLGDVVPSVSGPKRPQDRVDLGGLKGRFAELLGAPPAEGGYGVAPEQAGRRVPVECGADDGGPLTGGGEQDPDSLPKALDRFTSPANTNPITEREMMQNRPTPNAVEAPLADEFPHERVRLGHGDVVIAAITSCTNTSNPSVMLGAGLLAKRAVELGLSVPPHVKTSLAPGSRVVTDYLERTGLQRYLDELRFHLVGYGCTTCIGNSGPLDPHLERAVVDNDLVVASVLSGNRNFEARIHQSVKANFLMSPPLVVAFALAGTVDVDLSKEPIGRGSDGRDVYLRDLWPTPEQLGEALAAAGDPEAYRRLYADVAVGNDPWNAIPAPSGAVYEWDSESTYIQEPPFFEEFGPEAGEVRDVRGARPLAVFGHSVTTDHISPAGAIKPDSPAGRYLQELGVPVSDFNTYGARRGNDRVMTRGTFANVRIRNLLVPNVEGGVTVHQPSGERMSIFEAAARYRDEGVPLVVVAGRDYGMGSSRDWAAKGTLLLGVKAVIAESFERIHRSNLVGMGVLPLELDPGVGPATLGLDGTEQVDVTGLEGGEVRPRQRVTVVVRRAGGASERFAATLRVDTPVEVEYCRHGGILPYVLRELLARSGG